MTSQRTAIDTRRGRIAAIAALLAGLATPARSARADDVRFALGMFHFELLADGTSVSGPARLDALPEAGVDLYDAELAVAALADGPCGEQPISLALALAHDHDADVIAGGLTGYCGADRWFGVPVIEPLRIAGRMP